MKKIFTLSLTLALCSSVYAESIKFLTTGSGTPGIDEPQMMALGMSPSGQYVCGVIEMGAGVYVADVFSDEVKFMVIDDENGGELRKVDNNGLAVGIAETGISYNFTNGDFKEFAAPDGYRRTLCEALTNDGSLIVGSVSAQTFITNAAYTLDKGATWNFLPEPSKQEMGALAPRSEGSAAKRVSADGKVIYGIMGSFYVPTLWIRNDQGVYEPDFFLVRYYKGSEADRNDPTKPLWGVTAMRGMAMSNNGKYVGVSVLYMDPVTGQYFNGPAIYDTEEKKLNTYEEIQDFDSDGVGLFITAIANDGTMIGSIGQPDSGSYGSFIWRAGAPKAEKFNDAFPSYNERLGEADGYGFNLPTGISADGRYISGYAYYSSDWFDDSPAYYVTYIIDTKGGAGVDE
ncbi:MAG: hypothetical protein K2K97_05085, partial [Muribaculaceae bacterium]|nr:hypothetical protein [Muribaculaceae bacterium]